jgi:hypothetical protein
MMQINPEGHKPQTSPSVVVKKALKLLNKHAIKNGNDIISFKEVRRVWAYLYHLDRWETDQFIDELRALGLIRFFPYHGITTINKKGDEK